MQDGDAKWLTRGLILDADFLILGGEVFVDFSSLLELESRQAVISSIAPMGAGRYYMRLFLERVYALNDTR